MKRSLGIRWAILLGGLAMLASLTVLGASPTTARGVESGVLATSVPTDRLVYLGAWVGERTNVPGDVDEFERAIGKKLSIIHRYSHNVPYLKGEHFDVAWADWVRSRGAIPMVSWEPQLKPTAGLTLETAASGSRDDYVRLWARELRDWGHPIFFRAMWEQNNSRWFDWSAPSEPKITHFKQFWRRMVGIFREEGATNVTFVWSPHTTAAWTTPPMDTYPGDDYVDWVALDGYPWRAGRGDFYQTFKPDYDEITTKIPTKPLMIAETSLTGLSDNEKARVIQDALTFQLPTVMPKVKALVWFDEKYCGEIDYSILRGAGELSRQAFKKAVASDYYTTNSFGNLNISPIPIPELAVPNPPGPFPRVPALADYAANLLSNGAFEVYDPPLPNSLWYYVPPNVADMLPTGWSLGGYYQPNAVSMDRMDVHTGSYSLRHGSTHGSTYSLQQDVPVTAQSYNFQGFVKVAESWGWLNFSVQLQPLNASNGILKTINLASFRLPTNGWQEVKATNVAMPPGTAKLRVSMKVDRLNGVILADDFVLVPSNVPFPTGDEPPPEATATPTATPVPTSTPTATPGPTSTPTPTPGPGSGGGGGNLLSNSSFQSPLAEGWTVPSWVSQLVRIDPAAASDGDGRGLLLKAEGNNFAVHQDATVSPGTRYRLTGSIQLADARGGALNVELVALNRYNGTSGAPVSVSYSQPNQGWQNFSLEITAPSNAAKLRVQLKSAGFKGTAYVDALNLVAAN